MSDTADQQDRRRFQGLLPSRWADPSRQRLLFGGAYAVAASVVAMAIWLLAAAPGAGAGDGAVDVASRAVLYVLLANLILIGLLVFAMGTRVLHLVRHKTDDPASRLHLRFVTLFSIVAVVPAVLVALVFGVLVNRGVEEWFSRNVRAAVENGADIGRIYVRDVSLQLEADMSSIAEELSGEVRATFPRRIEFNGYLAGIAEYVGYPALYILDAEGQVLASGEIPGAPPYLAPPAEALAIAAQGEDAPVQVTENPDVVRALYPLPAYGDAYLYGIRPLQPGMIARLASGLEAIEAYREAEESRARIQAAFAVSYLETALLVLVGAMWLGMAAAGTITAPIARLVQAADKVASGDLTARLDPDRDPAEIAVLSRAFNRMTTDLQQQQEALRAAGEEARARSQFTESVLSGVSAGVIGLDTEGRVKAINSQAAHFLGVDESEALGAPVERIAPEFDVLIQNLQETAETEIDLTRDGETRRLQVRADAGMGGETVLTFDDITRLIAAQRNAAWKDVARRIAHEIKNPLTPIQLSAERLRRKYRDQVGQDVETFDRCTDTIIRQVNDIGRMVDEFSSFARMPAPRFAPENAAELLREAVFAQRVAAPDIPVHLGDDLPAVSMVCDGRMVAQALLNILKNAGEAVAAVRPASGGPLLAIHAEMSLDGDHLFYIIEDDGPGLPERDRDRLIEPYVTTREKGTGLGLAIVRRILEDHGGELQLADAQTLSGARICLKFPLRQSASSAPTLQDEATVRPASDGGTAQKPARAAPTKRSKSTTKA
ncbi:MAG: ATP-binding protein [Brevundimonas sp.]|uniref:sensor histidine kinase NtrY-like n=1 Tax=Brevundimonas sp. TaxID=1871086 RepID=UPI00391891A5